MKRIGTVAAMTLALVVGMLAFDSGTRVGATTVRTGARSNQMDVLFNRDETSSIARGWVGGVVACKWVFGAAAGAGAALSKSIPISVVASLVAGGTCMAMVTICAARAYVKGRQAGMTVSFPDVWHWWCWDY